MKDRAYPVKGAEAKSSPAPKRLGRQVGGSCKSVNHGQMKPKGNKQGLAVKPSMA